MSFKGGKNVPQLVSKMRADYPQLDRDLIRKLIRLENPDLFKDNPSNLKKLDRYLKRSYKTPMVGKTEAQTDFDNQLKMYRLAQKIADTGTPLTIRDVDWRLGKYHVKIEHE